MFLMGYSISERIILQLQLTNKTMLEQKLLSKSNEISNYLCEKTYFSTRQEALTGETELVLF